MSGGIQLSNELVKELKAVTVSHDPTSDEDIVFIQYLAAVTSFVLAHQDNPAMDKNQVLNDIGQFMAHVLQQVEADLAPPPPAEDAFGIWKPGQG